MRRPKITRKRLIPGFRGALYNTDPGANGGGGAGTGTPGTPTPGTGTGDDKPEYLSKKEFGQTAALITGLKKSVETISSSALTQDKLNEALAAAGILVKGEDGTYKPAFAPPAAKPEDKTGTPPPNPLETRVKALEKQLADAQKAVEEERTKTADEKLSRSVVEALRKAGAVNPERDYVHLKSMITADGDKYFVRTKDSAGVEQQFGLEEYASTWLDGNPELKKAQGSTGSGTKPGQGGSGVQTVSQEQARDPEWYLANREKIAKGEIRIARPA